MAILTGKITQVLHRSEVDGWICFRLKAEDGIEHKIVGHAIELHQDVLYECSGEIITHAKFGPQFQATSITPILPSSTDGILKYLESGMVAGLGKTYARKIVSKFGDNTLTILRDEPYRLVEIDGIGKKRMEKILHGWNEHAAIHEILQYLKQYDIGNADAFRIHKEFGNEAIQRINANPFSLTKIKGIGFQKADAVAANMGYRDNHPFRIRAGLHYALEYAANSEGHTAQEQSQLVHATAELLNVGIAEATQGLSDEIKSGKLIFVKSWEGALIYLPQLFSAERDIAHYIQVLKQGSIAWNPDGVAIKSDIALSSSQTNAVNTVIRAKVSVMTGGPGVGKTTVTRFILDLIQGLGATVLLCAPTGRAAKRMSESTGYEAKTIHRLLEFTGEGFRRNKENLLDCDLVVVDEGSMLDTYLTNALLKAIPSHAAVLFVGDIDQLASVGPGHILRDIIDSQQIAVVELTEIFRQAAGSQVIVNSHRINSGQMPLANKNNGDFFFLETAQNDIANTIIDLVCRRLPARYDFSFDDIQVLSPARSRGDCSVNALNRRLQTQLNPAREETVEIRSGGTMFREGDRVMQTRNNYDLDIFNGDIGKIESIDNNEEKIIIDFDGHIVELGPAQLYDIDLAYATTIHKSQGSEYPVVIIPVTYQHFIMLTRNLFYTGVTRGKQLVILVGEKKALHKAVCQQQSARITGLRSKLGGPVITNTTKTSIEPVKNREEHRQQVFD